MKKKKKEENISPLHQKVGEVQRVLRERKQAPFSEDEQQFLVQLFRAVNKVLDEIDIGGRY